MVKDPCILHKRQIQGFFALLSIEVSS
jgi:hypothetical protein